MTVVAPGSLDTARTSSKVAMDISLRPGKDEVGWGILKAPAKARYELAEGWPMRERPNKNTILPNTKVEIRFIGILWASLERGQARIGGPASSKSIQGSFHQCACDEPPHGP